MIQKKGYRFKVIDLFNGDFILDGYTLAGVITKIKEKDDTIVPEMIKIFIVDERDKIIQEIKEYNYTNKKKADEYEAKEYLDKLKKKFSSIDSFQLKDEDKKLLCIRCDLTATEPEQIKQYIQSSSLEFKTISQLFEEENRLEIKD